MSKNTRTRILLTAVAALLLVVVSVGGTLAWLQDKTETVTNTFKPSTIGIELDENKQWDGTDLGEDDWEAQFIPGVDLTKDPVVSVTTDVEAYVFVKVEVTGAWPDKATWTMAEGWTALDETKYPGVYYRETAVNAEYHVIAGDIITVSDKMTQADMTAMYKDNVAQDTTMTIQAWVIQKANGVDATSESGYSYFELEDAYKAAAGITD